MRSREPSIVEFQQLFLQSTVAHRAKGSISVKKHVFQQNVDWEKNKQHQQKTTPAYSFTPSHRIEQVHRIAWTSESAIHFVWPWHLHRHPPTHTHTHLTQVCGCGVGKTSTGTTYCILYTWLSNIVIVYFV